MKKSSRPLVRSPVGHKTKRGAELEGTPKTPASFDVSPCKSSCVDSFSQQPDDRRLHPRSRRPLQWNNLAKQGINARAVGGMTKDLIETTLCPFLHVHRASKSTGESEAVNALSPICVNAIQRNADQQGGWKAAMKKSSEMPLSLASPKVKDCNAALKRRDHGRVHEDAHWNATENCSEAGPGSYTYSPQNRISLLSEERIFLWSNAAFNQGLEHEETVCISKDTASSTSCSSARSCSRHKAVFIEGVDCEAESKNIDQGSLFGFDGGQRRCNATGGQRESLIVDAKNRMGGSGSDSSRLRDQETKPHGSRDECATELSESTLSRKLLIENDKTALASVVDCDAFPYLLQQKQRSETLEHTDIQKSVLQANQADKDEKERFEIGLDEIEHEIQRLTERLTELQLQKRAWKKKMRRHGEGNAKKAESAGYVGRKGAADKERSAVALLQQQQRKHAAVSGAKRGLQSPKAQSLRSLHEVVSKVRQESPLFSVRRRVQCPLTANVGKLSELTRSLSAAASPIRRKESSSGSSDVEAERSKGLRRLSTYERGDEVFAFKCARTAEIFVHQGQRFLLSFANGVQPV